MAYQCIEFEQKIEFSPLLKNSRYCQCVKNVCISVDCHVLTLGTKRLSWRKVQCCIPHWPTPKSICIGGVLYYKTVSGTADSYSMVVCFDLRTEKFSCVKFSGISSKAKPASQTLVNYNGKLGLLMSEDFSCVYGGSKSFELWVLRDAAKHEWFTHVYVLPLLWKDVVTETMCIDGMVGTNEIVYCRRATETCIPMSYTTMSRARRSQKLESKELKPFRVKNVKLL